MGVTEYYQGKNVLLTGTTGFIGKVMLEKFLRALPNVGCIYILIRKKKGLNTVERFKKEVLGSRCFDRCRQQYPNFDEFVNQKIRTVEGDLLKDGLGMSPADYKELTENLHVIINCAASVDFNARLDESIDANVYGTLKMFELAKNTRHLENFLHVSTAYVNADKRGVIEEKVYEENIDAERIVEEIYKMPKDKMVKDAPKIIGNFPNTYAFTKSMTERILLKRRGDITMTILRPSIVGAAWKEPYVGWVDSITAASAVYLLGGIGLLKYLEGNKKSISDQIPVDFVVDAIIVAAATYANCRDLNVLHSTISSRNPVTGGTAFDTVMSYWRAHPPEKRVGPCSIYVIRSPKVVQIRRLAQSVPTQAYSKIAYTIGNTSMKKKADKLTKMIARTVQVSELFKHFTLNEWIFLTNKTDEMKRFCTPDELKEYQLNITDVEWKKYFQYFAWGLHHYILREKVDFPTNDSERMDLLASLKHGSYVDDIKWAFNNGFDFKPPARREMKALVLASGNVKTVIQNLVANRKNKAISEELYSQQLFAQASQLSDRLMSTYSMPFIKLSAWMVNLILRSMYEKIVVDENSLAKLNRLDFKTKGPLVFLPSHRSFVDFVLISYIFFAYRMKCPHVGATEDFLHMAILPHLLRAVGLFFMKKDKIEHQELYEVILHEYLQRLMLDESWLQIFLEGTRSKFGKTLPPNVSLLNYLTDAYYEKKVPDIQLVPVTLNYERVVDADTFPFELLGEEKLKLSVSKLLLAYKKLSKNFGKVFIKFADPISLKEYTNKAVKDNQNAISPYNKDQRLRFTNQLGNDIMRVISDNLVIMPTSLVASILMKHRKGIIEENIIKKVEWLIPEVLKRGGQLSTEFVHVTVKNALSHLDTLLERKKDIFHPQFSAKKDYKNIILLAYYRNMLMHLFFNESIIACAIAAFGYELAWKDGVAVERLWESTNALQKLVGNECFTCKKLTKDHFEHLLAAMIQRGTFTLDNQKIKVAKEGEELTSYLCSLLWPFIEGYWFTSVFLFALKNRDQNTPFEKFAFEIQAFGESMHEERMLQFYEACSMDTIKNALNVYKERGLISTQMRYDENTKEQVEVIICNASEAQLKEVVDSNQKFLKHSLANTMDVPVDIARKSVLVDYPFMSKL